MNQFLQLEGKPKDDFYQAKYDYYKYFNLGIMFASSLMFFILFITDWQLYEQEAWRSLLLRSLIVIPLAVVFITYRKTSNYKIMSTISLIMVHAMVWGNILVVSYLSNLTYLNEGFLIMSLILLLVSFSAPPLYAMIAHLGLIVDILLADHFYHFSNLDIMLAINIQVIILLCIVDLIVTRFYYDHYVTQKKLNFALFHDPLTQVFNRQQLHKIMGEGHDLSCLSDHIAILIMDVDLFKQVNDNYGHDEGDRILMFVADCIRNCLRGRDLVIRWGGEEFVVLLFDCPQEQAGQVAERIRRSVEKSVNGVCRITISVGVAIYPGGDCFATIKKADQALYVAKHSGRNKVVSYEDLSQEELKEAIKGQTDA